MEAEEKDMEMGALRREMLPKGRLGAADEEEDTSDMEHEENISEGEAEDGWGAGHQRRFKDTPLMEITLRRYEKPYALEKRELIRKFCLSIGLLQPGDSRDIIVDVLHVMLMSKKEGKELSSEEVKDLVVGMRKNYNLPMIGIASSNIRRQIKRLRDMLLVEKVKNNYKITEFSRLHDIFTEKIEQYMIPSITSRVKEYFKVIDEEFA